MKKMCLNRILWKDSQVVKMNKYEKNGLRPLWFTLESFKDTMVISNFCSNLVLFIEENDNHFKNVSPKERFINSRKYKISPNFKMTLIPLRKASREDLALSDQIFDFWSLSFNWSENRLGLHKQKRNKKVGGFQWILT